MEPQSSDLFFRRSFYGQSIRQVITEEKIKKMKVPKEVNVELFIIVKQKKQGS